MRRFVAALAVALGLTLASGLVLPFSGPGGNAVSLALSQSLQTVSPFVAELAFPETPWPQGWSLVMGDADGAGGARIAAEATGADWVLVGKVEPGGWISAYLYSSGRIMPARFTSSELLASWAALRLGKKIAPVPPHPALDGPLAALMESAPHFDPALHSEGLSAEEREILKQQALLVAGLYAHGPSSYAKELPAAVIDYWVHRSEPEKMANDGVGPVWKAFFPIMNGEDDEAKKRALALLGSDRALDVAGALIILGTTNDPARAQAARKLTKIAPELPLGWEELSFAAFDKNDAALAKKALLEALRLEPQKSLYWTNLGWANYLLGEIYQAIYTSRRGLELEPNPVAAYNLGLFHALLGDYGDAFEFYRTALRLDDGSEVPMALRDLRDTKKSELLFWQGYLLARSGHWREARLAFDRFLKEHPRHRLAEDARRELSELQNVSVELRISGYHLGPLTVKPPFGAGEEIRPVIDVSSSGFLPSGKATVLVQDSSGKPVSQSVSKLTVAPLTSAFTRELEPFTVNEPGSYRLVVEYAGARAATSFKVGATHLGRQLLSHGLVPTDLDGNPLVPDEELAAAGGEKALIAATLNEIHAAAAQAGKIERFAKPLTKGPYKGKSVADLMAQADASLVKKFYAAVLKHPEMLDEDAVNAFANWLFSAR